MNSTSSNIASYGAAMLSTGAQVSRITREDCHFKATRRHGERFLTAEEMLTPSVRRERIEELRGQVARADSSLAGALYAELGALLKAESEASR